MLKHERVAAHYRRSIEEKELLPGQKFPTLQQVMDDRACSVNTANRAFKLMQREGLIVSRHGSGTIVAPSAELAVLSGAQSADRRKSGCGNQGPGERLDGHVAYTWACESADIASLLGISIGEDVVVRQRQRRDANGRANWHNTGYTHFRIVADVPEILDPTPMHGGWPDMYLERTGKKVTRGPQHYTARLATDDELHALELPSVGAVPVLVKRVLWSDPDGPVDLWEDVMAPGLWDVEKSK